MKQIYLFIGFVLSFSALHGQAKSSFDLSFEANRSFLSLSSSSSLEQIQEIIDYRDDISESISNFGIGIHYSQKLGNRLLLRSGIEYFRLGYEENTDFEFIGSLVPTSECTNRYTFNYFSIPLLARYEFSGTRFQPFIEIGPSLSFHSQNQEESNMSEFTIRSICSSRDNEDITLFAQAQVGANYNLVEQWQIFGAFGYRQAITETDMNIVDDRLNSFMLTMGIRRLINP